MPRIPSRKELEDILCERCMSGVWIEKLPKTKRYRNYLDNSSEHVEYRVIDRWFAQEEKRDRNERVDQGGY